MKIELRRVSYSSRLSEETAAYTADIWVDDKKRGYVRNDGHGGADLVSPPALSDEIAAYAKTLPKKSIPGLPGVYPESIESVLGALLDEHLATKDLKRLLKTKKVLVREGKLYRAPLAYASMPGDVVLNDMPFAEALKLFRSVAG